MSPKRLRPHDLLNFTGSEHWYRHPLWPSITYTDGARYVAEAGGAYWLLDAIVSHQHDPKVRSQDFQVWKLIVADDRSALLSCEDGDHALITSQAIAFTDFPLPDITLWLQNNVIFLPSEY
ncbi:MAG TPA: hypothetical protein PKY87_04275 [Terricaulis sp.]|nr:hypothetical protein [Terricaulis sp.]